MSKTGIVLSDDGRYCGTYTEATAALEVLNEHEQKLESDFIRRDLIEGLIAG